MDISAVKQQVETYKNAGKRMFTTTSLQTHSIVLLHIIHSIDAEIPVYFINTGFHFPETIRFKEEVSKKLNIKINVLNSPVSKHLQRDSFGNLLFTVDPDLCCYYNKVLPVDNLLHSFEVWINGVRASQNENRKQFHNEDQAAHGTLRFHPLLDWTDKMIFDYIKEYDLPRHPLEEKGYRSIGCEPCTRKTLSGNNRDSRWFGMNKTECGLNTDLIDKQ
jgi:phosphoadenosine phosphosulfate reductase